MVSFFQLLTISYPVNLPNHLFTANTQNSTSYWCAGTHNHEWMSPTGRLYSAGYSYWGNLATGGQHRKLVPFLIPQSYFGNRALVSVACGIGSWTNFVTDDGGIWAAGRNHGGHFGSGPTPSSEYNVGSAYSPYRIPDLFDNGTLILFDAVSAGSAHVLALSRDGRVWGNGGASYGELGLNRTSTSGWRLPIDPQYFNYELPTKIFALFETSFVLTANNTIFAFGRNDRLQLGLNKTTSNNDMPQPIPKVFFNDKKISTIDGGSSHALFLTEDGELFVVGANDNQQLGLGSSITTQTSPTPLNQDLFRGSPIRSIAAGSTLSFAVSQEGILYVWGTGALGFGATTSRTRQFPTQLSENVLKVWAGKATSSHGYITCDFNEKVDSFGNCIPTTCFGISGKNISVCSAHGTCIGENLCQCSPNWYGVQCEIASTTNVYAWGSNFQGQLGHGRLSFSTQFDPKHLVNNFQDEIIDMSVGLAFSLLLTKSGSIYSAGDNQLGQLGKSNLTTPDDIQVTHTMIPSSYFQSNPVVAIACGKGFSLALTNNGTLFSWGTGASGELGLGNITMQLYPTALNLSHFNDEKLVEIAVGVSHVFIRTETDSFYCFGSNTAGQLGLGNLQNQFLPVKFNATVLGHVGKLKKIVGGELHSIALTSSGKLFSSGSNQYGQLGINSTSTGTFQTPVEISSSFYSDAQISSLSAGSFHSIILTSNGSVYAFGLNSEGQLGVENTVNMIYPMYVSLLNVIQIATGSTFTAVLSSSGSIYSFGRNTEGQLGYIATNSLLAQQKLNAAAQSTPRTTWNSLVSMLAIKSSPSSASIFSLSCPDGWSGMNCTVPICNGKMATNANVCSGNGKCDLPNTCNCTTGFGGYDCGEFICFGKLSSNPLVCSSSGTCVRTDNCTCQTGYTGSECQFPTCFGYSSNDTNVCSGQGSCISPNICSCTSNYTGNQCQFPLCFGYNSTDPNVCSGRGVCVAPDVCSNCQTGWTGSQCQNPICFGIPSNHSNVCAGHGNCIQPDVCSCTVGYSGTQCDLTMCFGKSSNDTSVCSGRGSCIAPNICVTCTSGYGGAICQYPYCFGKLANDSTVCSINGACTEPDTCNCYFGWGRNNCSIPVCYGELADSPNVCSGLGSCSTPYKCVCDQGRIGSSCQHEAIPTITCYGVSSTDSNVCSGSGACIGNNKCECSQKTFGDRCQYYQFHWKKGSGLWSEAKNWLVETDYLPIPASRSPTHQDIVFCDSDGRIDVSEESMLFGKMTIGESKNTAFCSITFSRNSQFLDDVTLYKNSHMIFLPGNVTFSKKLTVFEEMTLPQFANVTYQASEMVFTRLINHGFLSFSRLSSLQGDQITNYGNLTIHAQKCDLKTNIFIESTGIVSFKSGEFSGESNIINRGTFEIEPLTNVTLPLSMKIQNENFFQILGSGQVSLFPFHQSPYSIFSMKRSTVISTVPISIVNGSFYASGFFITPLLEISSKTGLVKFLESSFEVRGSLYLNESCTLIVDLSRDLSWKEKLIVSHSLILDSLIYIKLAKETNIEVGETFKFLKYGKLLSGKTGKSQIALIGAAYKTAKLKLPSMSPTSSPTMDLSLSPQVVDLEIDLSIGNPEFEDKYHCHYFGNRRTIEVVEFKENKKIALTFTTPTHNGWVGFGFGPTSSPGDALIIVSKGGDVFQVLNHSKVISNRDFIDIASFKSQSVFSIGKEYASNSIFVSEHLLKDQKYVFFAENPDHRANLTAHTSSALYTIDLMKGPYVPCTQFLTPNRIESRSPISIALVLFAYLCLGGLCILFYQVQPLYSRGLSPIITLFFLIFQLGFESRVYDYYPQGQRMLCVLNGYLVNPLHQISFIMVFYYFIRYFSVIRLNTMKNTMTFVGEGGEDVTIYSKKVKFLKMIGKPWMVLICVFIYLVFVTILTTLVLWAVEPTQFLCDFKSLTALKILNTVCMSIIFIGLGFILFLDILLNYKHVISCNLKRFLFKKDPFLFRLQMYIFVPFLIFTLTFEVYFLARLRTIVDIIYEHKTIEIFNTIAFGFLVLIDVVFPLIVTMAKFVYWILKPVTRVNLIDKILMDPEGYELFLSFAKSEYAVENVLAWKDILEFKEKYKKLASEQKGESEVDLATLLARSIYSKYFAGMDSLLEVNVRSVTCKSIKECLDTKDIDETLFDEVLQDLRTNLSDTFFRLQSTPEYKHYTAGKELKNELLDKKIERQTILGQKIEQHRKSMHRGSVRSSVRKSRRNSSTREGPKNEVSNTPMTSPEDSDLTTQKVEMENTTKLTKLKNLNNINKTNVEKAIELKEVNENEVKEEVTQVSENELKLEDNESESTSITVIQNLENEIN